MKSRIVLIITLIMMFALPSSAQQAGTDPSASQGVQSDREPLRVPKAPDFWDGDDPNIVNLILHPFANKKYVHRLTDPIRDRLNELNQITAEQKARAGEIDARNQEALRLASEKVSIADQHASDADMKAQAALAAATQAAGRVASAEQARTADSYNGNAQTEIRFSPGQTALSKAAKNALDQMARPLKGQRGYVIEVRGFAPGNGSAALVNSKTLADSVVRYLVLTHSIPMYRIYELSLGNASDGSSAAVGKRASGAKVEVSVLKSDLPSTTPQK